MQVAVCAIGAKWINLRRRDNLMKLKERRRLLEDNLTAIVIQSDVMRSSLWPCTTGIRLAAIESAPSAL